MLDEILLFYEGHLQLCLINLSSMPPLAHCRLMQWIDEWLED